MAVPAGRYTLRYTVDPGPLFERLDRAVPVDIRRVGEDLLAKRLGELDSKDPAVRLKAISALRDFGAFREKIAPALVERIVADPVPGVRHRALRTLLCFPDQNHRHAARILPALGADAGFPMSSRSNLAYLLGRQSPRSARVEEALSRAAADAEADLRRQMEGALAAYRNRFVRE